MRVLDLGAHDGFVGNWLARNLPEQDLHIDGVELHPDGVRIAQERHLRDGIKGQYKIGLAEDAPALFNAGTYDAVIAFEIIEHVPDVDKFLKVCENMLAPGGRIYISTPDGCFGSGQNPHHLRAYRAVDLFDLLRRRGNVENMVIGEDGVTVISYAPREKFITVAIYCGPGWEKWHPIDIEQKGLGGSETAAIRLAEAYAKLGFVVTVYGECDHGAWGQVLYKPHHCFDPSEHYDRLIVSRIPAVFDSVIGADHKYLWMHDTDYADQLTPGRIDGIDNIMVLSEWHREHVIKTYLMDPEDNKVTVTRNGINPDYFETEDKLERNPHRALYTSSPDRGLDFLLELWPKVRERIPDAELFYCYSNVYNAVANVNPMIAEFRQTVMELADQPGVVNMGSMPQNALALAMREAGVWLAPSWASPQGVRFHETYCIGAVEAAAAGCHIIASKWGALTERCEQQATSGALLESTTDRPDEDAWVDAIVYSMQKPAPEPSKLALMSTWMEVALDFEEAANTG